MALYHVAYIFLVLLVAETISMVIVYLLFKWTFRTKFILLLCILTWFVLGCGAFLFLSDLSIPRIFVSGIVIGGVYHLAIGWFMRYIITPINEIKKILGSLSSGDFTKQLAITSRDEFGEICTQLNSTISEIAVLISSIKNNTVENLKMVENLNKLSAAMSDNAVHTSNRADTVAASAEEMSSSMTTMASAIEQASTNISMVATSVESNNATINEIAQNCEKARVITNEAVQKAIQTSSRVEELGKATQNISKVTETITEISEQTNLLALNATIEAARAGESGKGFAVVANEIKDLARQTAEATHEIKSMIDSVQKTTAGASSEIHEISKVINDCNDIVTSIAASVEEQSVTTREISNNVSYASTGMSEINETVSGSLSVSGKIANDISGVNQDASQMADSSAQVRQSAGDLSKLAEILQKKLEKFNVLRTSEA